VLIVEFEGPPSWSLDASKTGESTKCPWVGVVEGMAGGKNSHALHYPSCTWRVTDCYSRL